MRVPGKVEYALRAAVELAGLAPGVVVPAGDLADRLGLPRRFVEQQVTELARAGLVTCRRGPGGGCMLARSACDITAGDVVGAVAGELLEPPLDVHGATGEMWRRACAHLREYLGGVDLAALAELEVRSREAGVYQI